MVKPDVDTLPTVPDEPPAAGPDRALDPPPAAPPLPGPRCPGAAEGDVAVAEGVVAVAEGVVAQPAVSPTTAHVSAAATIHRRLPFGSRRRAGRGSTGLVGSYSCTVALL
jgi:hypothetical protein